MAAINQSEAEKILQEFNLTDVISVRVTPDTKQIIFTCGRSYSPCRHDQNPSQRCVSRDSSKGRWVFHAQQGSIGCTVCNRPKR